MVKLNNFSFLYYYYYFFDEEKHKQVHQRNKQKETKKKSVRFSLFFFFYFCCCCCKIFLFYLFFNNFYKIRHVFPKDKIDINEDIGRVRYDKPLEERGSNMMDFKTPRTETATDCCLKTEDRRHGRTSSLLVPPLLI